MLSSSVQEARSKIDSLTIEEVVVCGKFVYFFWVVLDFGEVYRNARGANGSQINLFGTGIGSFNDRVREAVNGGSPFGDPRIQGFATGLYNLPNGFDQGPPEHQKDELMGLTERIIVAMAGNLRDYLFVNRLGEITEG